MGPLATLSENGKVKTVSIGPTIKNNNGQDDEYKLSIGLAQGVFNDMTSMEDGIPGEDITDDVPDRPLKFEAEVSELISLAERAVDLPELKTLASALANNEKVDKVEVRAIGLDDQSGTKADLNIIINGQREVTNNDPDKANDVLDKVGKLSVKYNSTLLGQTGKGWLSKGKSIGIKDNIKNIFGIDLVEGQAEWEEALADERIGKKGKGGAMIKQKLSELVMKPVFDHVSEIIRGKDDPKKLEQLLDGIYKGVNKAATKGEEGIGFVSVGKGAIRYLDWYDKLQEAIVGKNGAAPTDPKTGKPINLEITHKTQGNPMLLFYDASVGEGEPTSPEDDNVMFYYRGKPETEGLTMRTYIQYGKRLEELVEISEPEGDQATADAVVAKAVTPDEESEDS